MSQEARFRLLASSEIAETLAKIVEGWANASRDTGCLLQIQREPVFSQSIEGLCALVVAVGGGAGFAAVIAAIAKAIALVRDKNPNGKVILDTKGHLRELHGYSVAEIHALLEEHCLDRNKSAQNVVQAIGLGDDCLIDKLYDPISGTYFAPGVEGETIALGDPDKPAPHGRRLLIAFLDTGIMPHHPWISGRIKALEDFTDSQEQKDEGKGIDRNGHGTLVVLQFLRTVGQLLGQRGGFQLLIGKVLNKQKTGTEESLKAGLRWASDNGATTINLSLAIYRPNRCPADCEVCSLVESLDTKGIQFFLAAGNDPHRITCPQARGQRTFKVGASENAASAICGYSGPGTSMVFREAPGLRRIPSDG
jgi:hypothetical protein